MTKCIPGRIPGMHRLLLSACALAVAGVASAIPIAWTMNGFNTAGGATNSFVLGPSSNGALMYRLNPYSAPPEVTDPSPPHEAPGVVVDGDDTAYLPLTNLTGYSAVQFNGTVLWTFMCAAGTYAVTTPALATLPSGPAAIFVCTSSLGTAAYAVSTASAALVWKAQVAGSWAVASPMVGSSYVLVASDSGTAVAFRLADGGVAWSSPNLGSAIRGTPCGTAEAWFVFTTGGLAAALSPTDGSVLWNSTVFPSGEGPTSSCAVSTDSNFVAVGGYDFAVHVLSAALGTPVCNLVTGGAITQGVSATNTTFLVVSTDDSVRGVSPVPVAGSCAVLFTVPGVPDPTKCAVDGVQTAYVGFASGVMALNTAWWPAGPRVLWTQNSTLEWYNPVAVGPSGVLFTSTRQGSFASLGATGAFLSTHKQDAVMRATANVNDPSALAELQYLCVSVTGAVNAFVSENPVTQLDPHLLSELNDTCSMYSLVLGGYDPSGMPPNFADFSDSSEYTNELTTVWVPLLQDVENDVTVFNNEAASMQQLVQQAQSVYDSYATRLVSLEQALSAAQAVLGAVASSVIGIEARVELTALTLDVQMAYYADTWLQTALNFTDAALNNATAGMEQYQDALNDFGRAVHSSVWTVLFHSGDIMNDIQEGVAALEKAVNYLITAGIDAAIAAQYFEWFEELVQIDLVFQQIVIVNQYIMDGNVTLPELIPAVFTQEINVEAIGGWLDIAQAALIAAPGGVNVVDSINSYIADTKALITSDLAYVVAYQQVASIEAQLAVLLAEMEEVNNNIVNSATAAAAVGSALTGALHQQYMTQLRALRVANRACEQYTYWTLSTCAACPLAPYPTSEQLLQFVAGFDACPVPSASLPQQWFNLYFNRSTHPDAFADIANGNINLELYLPANPTYFNVRTQDYRVYVLPLDALVLSTQYECPVFLNHTGSSQFVDGTGNVYSFEHSLYSDNAYSFWSQSDGCTSSTHSTCQPPQCASTFNLSPYGLWSFRFNPEWFTPDVTIETIVFQLYLQFNPGSEPPGPNGLQIFEGPDSMEQISGPCQVNTPA